MNQVEAKVAATTHVHPAASWGCGGRGAHPDNCNRIMIDAKHGPRAVLLLQLQLRLQLQLQLPLRT